MSPQQDPFVDLLPASGPKLNLSIEVALLHLRQWADDEGQKWEKLDEPDARLWRELLQQTRDRPSETSAPNLLKSQVAVPAVFVLDERGWKSFLVWFRREISEDLARACAKESLPAVVPVRRSNRSGGRPESSEAIYYLAFAPKGAATETRSRKPGSAKPHHAPAPGAQAPAVGPRQRTPGTDKADSGGVKSMLPTSPGYLAAHAPMAVVSAPELSPAAGLYQRFVSIDWLLVGTVALGIVGSISLCVIAYAHGQGSIAEADGTGASLVSLIELIRDLMAPSPFAENL